MQYPKIFKKIHQAFSSGSTEPSAQEIEQAQLRSSFVNAPTRHMSYVDSNLSQHPFPKRKASHISDDLLSEEAIHEQEHQRSIRAARKESTSMIVGNLYKGKVTGVRDYGVFVTFPNQECGLVFINEVCWDGELKEDDPVPYSKGDIVTVEVLSFSPGRGLSLSLKRPRRNEMFRKFTDAYTLGSVISGTVISVKDYGAFVRVAPGVDGLFHITLAQSPESIKRLSPGSSALVIVDSFDMNSNRLALREPGIKRGPP